MLTFFERLFGSINPNKCIDCHCDTRLVNEYYMVTDDVWEKAVPKKEDRTSMLCVGCLENRLGRNLNSSDFIDYPINTRVTERSGLLTLRLQTPPPDPH